MKLKWPVVLLAVPLFAQPAIKTMKLKDIPIRDPFILADEKSKTYYLYASANASETGQPRGGLKAFKSKDLVTWEGPHIVCVLPEDFWAGPKGGSAIAPEVHLYKGRYYLFGTFQSRDRYTKSKVLEGWRVAYREGEYHPVKGTQILGTDSPDGPFKPLENRLTTPEEFRTLDGTLYVEDGTPYMVRNEAGEHQFEVMAVIGLELELAHDLAHQERSAGAGLEEGDEVFFGWFHNVSDQALRQRQFNTITRMTRMGRITRMHQ